MDSIFQQLKETAKNVDDASRQSLLAQLQELQFELEKPNDTVQRVMFLNCQMSVVRVGIDLKIFNHLVDSHTALTVEQVVEKADADSTLVGRILRYLACTKYIKQEAPDLFSATHITSCIADADTQAGIHHYFDFLGPIYQILPTYLAQTNYKNITDPTNAPLHHAYNTTLEPWAWFQTQPAKALAFNTWAAARERNMPSWTATYPLLSTYSRTTNPIANPNPNPDSPPPPVLFVDIGGGFGQQSALVRSTYPHLPGRVIVQDLAPVLERAPALDGVEKMAHDMFAPQPVETRGARFYYLRQVLHDHADERAAVVLRNVREAMSACSVLLVDEIVISDADEAGGDWMGVHMDVVVMAGLAGMERTRAQWEALVKRVGLRVREVYRYNMETSDSILEIVLDE